MLYTAIALVAVALGCALVLSNHHAEAASTVVEDHDADPAVDAWRAAALDAHRTAKRLRHGITNALDAGDARLREAILRDALTDTRQPSRVHTSL